MKPLRIAMLHLAPVVADVAHNRALAERGLARAAGLGAQWVITIMTLTPIIWKARR